MKALTVLSTKIHCDICHHEFEGMPPEWHNRPCPECGAENIVTDSDMAAWKAVQAVKNAVNELFGEVPEGLPEVTISFSTAPNKK